LEKCKSLQALHITSAGNLTDAAIKIIMEKKLKGLILQSLSSSNVTQQQLQELIKNCKDVEYLDLGRNDSLIDDAMLIVISENCTKLKSILLEECNGITSGGLNTLLTKVGDKMLYLDVGYCGIEQSFLPKIPELCPNLLVLYIYGELYDKQSRDILLSRIDDAYLYSDVDEDFEENGIESNE